MGMRKQSVQNKKWEVGCCHGQIWPCDSQAFVTSLGGRMCKSLELCARKTLGYYNQGLMGHAGKTVEDQMLLEGQMVKTAQQVVGELRTLLRPGLVTIFVIFVPNSPPPKKILAIICPCSKNLRLNLNTTSCLGQGFCLFVFCLLSCPGAHYVDHAGQRDPPTSTSLVLVVFKSFATTLSFCGKV